MPSYLTAGKIKEGMSGTISGEPREEKHDFQDGKGEKLLFRVPIKLDSPIVDDYSEEKATEWTWNPGVFARSFLENELGEDYQQWINTHGSFHPKAWASKTRNGFAWHFIPDTVKFVDNNPAQATATEEPQTEAGKKMKESIDRYEAAQLKNFPKQVASTPVGTTIECAYCSEAGDFWSTSKTENMKAHIEKFHPDKVTKESKVKIRAKKNGQD